jgi:hypothetical protein
MATVWSCRARTSSYTGFVSPAVSRVGIECRHIATIRDKHAQRVVRLHSTPSGEDSPNITAQPPTAESDSPDEEGRQWDFANLTTDIELAEASSPSRLEGTMIILGITPLSVLIFATSLVLLLINGILGDGWLGDLLHIPQAAEVGLSRAYPEVRVDGVDNLL